MASSSRVAKRFTRGWPFALTLGLGMFSSPSTVWAAGITLDLGNSATQQTGTSLQILMLLTVLSLAPAILMMMTAFTRIIIVLSFVRNALGTQQLPPNQVMVGLALFLTFFVMLPTWNKIDTNAVQPLMKNQITQAQA
ncbi:MAG TPA: flagellar biosynthetic protein FliP, partial [Desulfosporosinus sp.]|nr:flagellar biosynthetic protein FliP [Desulfosporosinus sp.]